MAISHGLIKYMVTIRQTFRDTASQLVERHFGICNQVEQAVNQMEEHRTQITALLSTPNFGFLHTMTDVSALFPGLRIFLMSHQDMYGDVEIVHFSHPCIADIITHVIWRVYGSGSFAATASFTPIMAVTVTAIVVALRELRTGQYRKLTLQGDQFLETYEQATLFIESIQTNPLYVENVTNMIMYSNTLIPPVEDEEEDSSGQGSDNMLY